MTFKQFITLMIIATVSLWIGWWWVVLSIDPFGTGPLGFLLFYGVLFLSLIGSFTLAGVYMRKMRLEHALVFHLVLLSFRQAVVLALFFLVLLVLQGERLLYWWNVLGLFAIVIIIEVFMLRKERRIIPSGIQLPQVNDVGFSPRFSKKEIGEADQPIFEISEITDIEINL